jgi:hypothetical protein
MQKNKLLKLMFFSAYLGASCNVNAVEPRLLLVPPQTNKTSVSKEVFQKNQAEYLIYRDSKKRLEAASYITDNVCEDFSNSVLLETLSNKKLPNYDPQIHAIYSTKDTTWNIGKNEKFLKLSEIANQVKCLGHHILPPNKKDSFFYISIDTFNFKDKKFSKNENSNFLHLYNFDYKKFEEDHGEKIATLLKAVDSNIEKNDQEAQKRLKKVKSELARYFPDIKKISIEDWIQDWNQNKALYTPQYSVFSFLNTDQNRNSLKEYCLTGGKDTLELNFLESKVCLDLIAHSFLKLTCKSDKKPNKNSAVYSKELSLCFLKNKYSKYPIEEILEVEKEKNLISLLDNKKQEERMEDE